MSSAEATEFVLANLTSDGSEADPKPLTLQRGYEKGSFFYDNRPILMDYLSVSHSVSNTWYNGIITTVQASEYRTIPCEELLELLKRQRKLRFEFNPETKTWQGKVDEKISGAVYNTAVYLNKDITLTFDLNNLTGQYKAYSYSDTSS